jgi:hypothetical protein
MDTVLYDQVGGVTHTPHQVNTMMKLFH